jgi:DNA-binding transcriptional LysR family regulator
MQIETLKLFCDVVRLHSFSRGAAINNVLQSAASQAVQAVEESLGVSLIDRSVRPWKLTPEGRTFYEGCQEVLEKYFALENVVKRRHQDTGSVVRVASIYSVGLGDMNQYVRRFMEEHPRAEVEIEYLHPDKVYERVTNDEVDFGIVSFPQHRKELQVIPWREEPMVVVCDPRHRFARRKSMSPSQLSEERFVAFDSNLGIRREVDRYLKKNGAEVNVVLEFDNIEAIKRAVEVGSGLSILPQPTLQREVKAGTLRAIPLSPRVFVRPLGIIHRRSKKFYPQTRGFIELILGRRNGEIKHAA